MGACSRFDRLNKSQLIILRFLWAALQLENLCKQRSDFDMEKELLSLPNGLNETYGRMIKQINTQTTAMQRVAQKAFLWMNYSLYSIDCNAMSVAVVFGEDCKSIEDLERKRYDEEVIIEACAGLLIVEDGHFRFIHHSVFEYFIDPPEEILACQYSKCFSDSKSASLCLAKDCLSYMLLKGAGNPNDSYEFSDKFIFLDAFFRHAAESFDQYLQSSGDIPQNIQNQLRDILSNSELCKLILQVRDTPNPATLDENASALVFGTRLYDLFILHTDHGVWRSREIPSNALHLAAGYGSLAAVRWLLDLGQAVNDIDQIGVTPLTRAASQGHLETVKYLVAMGSDVNTQDRQTVDALYSASSKGHLEVVKYLTKVGADINRSGPLSTTALEGACRADSSRLELVTHLIENGADVSAQGGQYRTVLQTACSTHTDDLELVKYLVEKGADVNAKGGQYGSALQASSWRGNVKTMKYLIEQGADVNVQAGQGYGTVLQGLVGQRNIEMMT